MSDIEDDYDFRQRVCAWLSANGVDPKHTPMYPDASIADGRLTLRQKVQHDGHDVVRGGEVVTHTITVPVLVEPDAEIAEWLRPECPACGR
jgi:hypothetical protein